MIGPREIRQSLVDAYEAQASLPSHVDAFAAWATRGELGSMDDALKKSLSADGLARRPEYCAALGYAIHSGTKEKGAIDLFKTDVEQLSGRRFFEPGRPPAFEIDGVALLGVALGLRTLRPDDNTPEWFSSITLEAEKRLESESWVLSLVRAANYVASLRPSLDLIDCELRTIVADRLGMAIDHETLESAWAATAKLARNDDGPSRIAARFAVTEIALARAANVPIAGMSIDDLAVLLRGLERSMRLWTWETTSRTGRSIPRQWHVDHEYHVQNLLWTILAPIVPKLEDEVYLPSVGQKTPRADIGVPSLRTIIETKFIGKKGPAQFKKVIEEIAEDASLYRTKMSDYDFLIAVIWDDFAQTEEYEEAVSGLKKIPGVFDAVILPRPAKMEREPESDSGK